MLGLSLALPVQKNLSSGAVSVATNSIVFASASSQSLTATGKTNINQQKFTFAAWFKTSTVATQALFYLGDGTTANRVFARINLNGTISFLGTTASASAFTLVTSGAFADGKWHSVVFAMNTTQAGANNRAIIYVDGVAAPLGINTQPAQNANLSNNFAATNLIGSQQPVAGTFFNGNLAQVYYIDGQQLTPSSFITGTPGVPKTYSGSYTGTFDFFLNFANAGSLGADTSGEGNNWTPQNSPTQSTDHP